MYSFDLTDEQQMLVETVHRYAAQQLRPLCREAEEAGQVPAALVARGWDLGLLPAQIGADYGGFGAYEAVTSALYLEELGWGDVGISLHLLTPSLFALPITLFGSEAQKAAYLPACCAPDFPPASAALIEPVYRFDSNQLATTAAATGESYTLSGQKSYVPLADGARHFLVYANEKGRTQAFIVPAETPGLIVGARVMWMGARALGLYSLTLDQVEVPKANRLGGPRGIRFSRLLTISRIGLAALAVGQARAAHEYALHYAKEREAFGEPIAHRQSIAFLLANMAIEIEAARLLCWEAAYRLDAGEDATRAAVMAYSFAQKMVLQTTDGAVQVLGGHGYIREHPVELWLRNGRGFAAWEGMVVG